MEDHTRVKRLKSNTTVIYPNLTQRSTSTDLFKETSTKSVPPIAPDEPRLQDQIDHLHIPIEAPETSHQRRTLQDTLSWENCREELLTVHFNSLFPTSGCTCVQCDEEIGMESHIRCKDCNTYFCSLNCLKVTHNGRQLAFHKPEIWKSAEKKYCSVSLDIHLRRTDHRCAGQYLRSGIQVFDQQGRIHTVNVTVCTCEKNATTLMRHQLWASSVDSSSVCFHIELLMWIEYLVLEARTSLMSICQAIRWKNDLTVHEFNTLYRGIVGECFEQFRHFHYKVGTMEHISQSLVDNGKCPACPKQSGSIFISLDANFGLVRKQNSGTSLVKPKHSGKIFADQAAHASLSLNHDNTVNKDTVCSNFQAGSNLRSKNKAAKLDVTGVFGSCCRHGVPHTFINLDRGERLCYSIHVINKLLDELTGTNVKLHILYDIACLLYRHIQTKHDTERYEGVAFAVPIFHAYAHKASCQVNYSTRWLPGFGLTDGEEMERIWSYLRRFSIITKEMTPSHRIDLLTDGLLHYKQKKVSEIDLTLAKAMQKAQCVIRGTTNELDAACRDLSVSPSKVDEWVKQDKEGFSQEPINEEPVSSEEKYVQSLLMLDNVMETYSRCNNVEAQKKLQKQYSKLSADVKKVESDLRIKKRWEKKDGKFLKHKNSLEEKKKGYMLKKLHRQATEYKFILTLKNKYCDGQAIATRLSKSILRVTKGIRKSISEYNDSEFSSSRGLPSTISWADAANTSAEMYVKMHSSAQMSSDDDEIPFTERQRLVDLKNRQNRAREEIELTEEEMASTLIYFEERHNIFQQVIQDNEDQCKGVLVSLQQKAANTRKSYFRANSIFSRYTTTPLIPDSIAYPADFEPISDSVLEDELNITEIEEIEDDGITEDVD